MPSTLLQALASTWKTVIDELGGAMPSLDTHMELEMLRFVLREAISKRYTTITDAFRDLDLDQDGYLRAKPGVEGDSELPCVWAWPCRDHAWPAAGQAYLGPPFTPQAKPSSGRRARRYRFPASPRPV